MLRRSSVFLSEKWKSSYCVWLFAAPWIAACQAHLSMEFSRQEYWNHSFLQGIFTTQGWNSGLPFCTWILYHLSHQGSPRILEWVSISFFRWSSWPRDRICVSRIGRWILYHWVTREAPDFGICWFCSVTKSCPTLCCSMNCSMPGFPVLHRLPDFAQTHVHWVCDTVYLSHSLSPPSPHALNHSQHQGLFQWVSFSYQVGEGNGYPLQYSCLENSMDRGAWQATVLGVIKSQTRLNDLGNGCLLLKKARKRVQMYEWHQNDTIQI